MRFVPQRTPETLAAPLWPCPKKWHLRRIFLRAQSSESGVRAQQFSLLEGARRHKHPDCFSERENWWDRRHGRKGPSRGAAADSD
jgi:hypothetical protein